jgi:hypothetical protein
MPYVSKILAFAGSLRTESFNKKLAKLAAEAARRAGGLVTLIDLRDLPLPVFDQDLEARDGGARGVSSGWIAEGRAATGDDRHDRPETRRHDRTARLYQ